MNSTNSCKISAVKCILDRRINTHMQPVQTNVHHRTNRGRLYLYCTVMQGSKGWVINYK
jgi:hypothetical protein